MNQEGAKDVRVCKSNNGGEEMRERVQPRV